MYKIKPKHLDNSTMAISIGTPQPIADITLKLQVDWTNIRGVCIFMIFIPRTGNCMGLNACKLDIWIMK